MTADTIYKIQAYADGELTAAERQEVEALLQVDGEAKTLLSALQEEKSWLAGNELPRVVPEPRDFYFSKIQKGIERAETLETTGSATHEPTPRSLLYWLRWLLPVGALSLIMILALLPQFQESNRRKDSVEKARSYHEMDHPLDSGSLITFRSEAEGVTVFWITSD